jgi:DNA mismatch endonuclease (patch repair protein)
MPKYDSDALCSIEDAMNHNHLMDSLADTYKQGRMATMRSKRTRPERLVAAVLLKMGVRFQQNDASLPGSPDFVLDGTRKIIFVHGCFWHRHGCDKSSTPRTNRDYWIPKFARNVKRDRKVVAQLKRRGWLVLVLWECKLSDGRSLFQVLRRFMDKPDPNREVVPRKRQS